MGCQYAVSASCFLLSIRFQPSHFLSQEQGVNLPVSRPVAGEPLVAAKFGNMPQDSLDWELPSCESFCCKLPGFLQHVMFSPSPGRWLYSYTVYKWDLGPGVAWQPWHWYNVVYRTCFVVALQDTQMANKQGKGIEDSGMDLLAITVQMFARRHRLMSIMMQICKVKALVGPMEVSYVIC